MFAVYYNDRYWWQSYQQLKDMCSDFDRQCDLYEQTDGEEGVDQNDYQSDSPYADFITGYNTDTYADESIELMTNIWEEYVDNCEEEDKTPTWDDCWDTFIWENFDYQLLHTWLRVTNIHIEDDEDIKRFAKESDYCTMSEKLGL